MYKLHFIKKEAKIWDSLSLIPQQVDELGFEPRSANPFC